MNIRKYYGKKISITTMDQKHFAGTVIDYVFPEDNDPEGESIIIRSLDGALIEFRGEEIREIDEVR